MTESDGEVIDNLQVMTDQLVLDLEMLREWLETPGIPLATIELQKHKIALMSAEITVAVARRVLNLP